ncbi:hypothetical protein EJB05_18860 [Eragrostis curvula]|uniref:Uncharacterized protein n=1 Tax=Eragrostis curvula TaxID=38414 RepID=A0A5J9VN32_9POAL|nr:hypothetical protein EJB05_18860 [Eragrostis curvula]
MGENLGMVCIIVVLRREARQMGSLKICKRRSLGLTVGGMAIEFMEKARLSDWQVNFEAELGNAPWDVMVVLMLLQLEVIKFMVRGEGSGEDFQSHDFLVGEKYCFESLKGGFPIDMLATLLTRHC